MKLYTREQMIEAFNYGKTLKGFDWIGDMIDSLEAIQLPSDEEIKQEAERLYPLTGHVGIDSRNHLRKKGFIDGMECMRNKIQGGNNEQ